MNPTIEIDFIGGTHGNFLEFILNQSLSEKILPNPFTNIGTSHIKPYMPHTQPIQANHYTENSISLKSNNAIVIQVDENANLLQIQSISLFRSGDFKISGESIIENAYNVLNNRFYKNLLSNLCESYNLQLDKDNPSCPRHILREFFKFGFANRNINGLVVATNLCVKNLTSQGKRVYIFPVSSFYDFTKFANEIRKIEKFFDLTLNNFNYYSLHNEFLSHLKYFINLNFIPDQIIDAVAKKQEIEIPNLTVLQESYINGNLERIYKKEMPFMQKRYFTNTKKIIKYLKL